MTNQDIREQLIHVRDEYIELIKNELMGPGSEFTVPDFEHELISSSPLSRYSVGILFPQGDKVEQDNDETVIIGEELQENHSSEETVDERENEQETQEKRRDRSFQFDETADENLDEEIGMATQYKPSSMGVTFLVRGNTDRVHCKVSFATYRKATVSDCVVPYEPENSKTYTVPSELAQIMTYDNKAFRLRRKTELKEIREIFERDTIPEEEYNILRKSIYRLHDFMSSGYVREPHIVDDVVISFRGGNYADNEENSSLDGTNAKMVALRTKISGDIYSLTVMLVNELESSPAKATQCIFQSRIDISTDNNEFLKLPTPKTPYKCRHNKGQNT